MAKLRSPQNFDFSNPNKWGRLETDDDIQVATLIYSMGKEADIYLNPLNCRKVMQRNATPFYKNLMNISIQKKLSMKKLNSTKGTR